MKLNLGSGIMLKKNFVNYDMMIRKPEENVPRVVGMIENLSFKENSFDEVLCSHVIEHFQPEQSIQMLRDIYYVLKPDGLLIIEGPDILGAYWYYVGCECGNRWKGRPEPNVKGLIDCIFANVHRYTRGEEWTHKSGWTGCMVAQEMAEIGFYIKHVGKGWTHGMGRRDFRVEGIKR